MKAQDAKKVKYLTNYHWCCVLTRQVPNEMEARMKIRTFARKTLVDLYGGRLFLQQAKIQLNMQIQIHHNV